MSISQTFRALRKTIASIASASIFTMAVTVAPQASAQTFNDVPTSHWSYEYVEQLVEDGIIDANDNYRPDDSLNRAELVKIAVEATTGIQTDLIPSTPTFDDVPADAWYYQYVETAAALGVVEGYKDASGNMTGLFGPSDTVNRAAATKILVNAYGVPTDTNPAGIFRDVDESAWYYDYVTTAYNQSIIDGYKDSDGDLTGYFGPGDPVTRAQVAKLAVNATDPTERVTDDEDEDEDTEDEDTEDEDDEDEDTDTVTTADGDLEISLSSDSMESATVPSLANVDVATFDFTAGSDDIIVYSIVLKRGGIGNEDEIESAVLKDGEGNRISKSKTVNSDDEITFNILGSGLEIPEGDTVEVVLVVATAEDSTGIHNFSIVSADAVASNAQEVVGDFPITSNSVECSSTPAGNVRIDEDGTMADIKVGESEAVVAKFELDNDDVEDVSVTQITLKNTGTSEVADALDNILLLAEGEEVAEGSVNDDYVTFQITGGYDIDKSKSVSFEVVADVVGEAGKTLDFDLDSKVDIEGEGANYGFGIGVTDSYDPDALSIEAGEITIVKVEPVDSIQRDKEDVVLATVEITVNSGEEVEMIAFNAQIVTTGSGVTTLLDNIELYDADKGTVYDLANDAASDADTDVIAYERDLDISLDQGEVRTFELRADTEDVPFDGNTITVSISNIGDKEIEDGIEFQEVVDDEYVTDVVPSSLTFDTISGESSSATVSILTQSTTKSAVIGTEDVEVLKFQIKAGSASDLVLSEVEVKGNINGTSVLDNTLIDAITLYHYTSSTDVEELDVKSGSKFSSSAVTFDGFEIDIAADDTEKFLVTVDIIDDDQADATIQLSLTGLDLEDADSDDVDTVTVDGAPVDTDDINVNTTAESPRTVTVVGVGSLATVVDNTDSETDKAKLVLGNTTSDYVASYELTATNEDILIETLTLDASGSVASSANFKQALSDVIIYDEDDNEIARESVTSDEVEFDNIDYVVEEGSENIYVKVKTNKMGKDAAGAIIEGIKLALVIDEAEGDASGESIATMRTDLSLAFSTVPTRISGAEFVSSCGSKSVASKLTNGSNNVAILKLTTDSSSNTSVAQGSSLVTELTAMRFDFEVDSTVGVDSMTVEKINGTNTYAASTTLTSTTGGVATVNLGDMTATNLEIDNSTSVCYLIKGTFSGMDSDEQGYIQIYMNDLDAGTATGANITYDSDDDDADGLEDGKDDRNALLLDDSSIESTKLSSSY